MTADIYWPGDLAPFQQSFYLQPHVGGSESPFTRQRKTYELSAPRWVTDVTFRGGYDGYTAQAGFGRRLDALIDRMRGGARTVTMWDFRRPGLSTWETEEAFSDDTLFDDGEGFSTELIGNDAVGVGATEMTLPGAVTSGLAPDLGDYVGGDGRPHRVTERWEDGDDIVLAVNPPFGTAIEEDHATFVRVPGTFRVDGDDSGANGTEVGQLTVISLRLVEEL